MDEMRPADYAAISGNNGNGWGGAWGEWIILFLIFGIFGGWGGNRGFGGYGGGGQVGDNYVLTSDFAQLSRQLADSTAMTERKLDGVNNGLCSGFYENSKLIANTNMQNANNTAAIQSTLTQGFAGLNTALVQNGYETRNAIQNAQVSDMQNFNAVQSQIAQCCCDTRVGIADVNYNVGMQFANTQRQIADSGYMVNTAIDKGFCQTNYNNANNTRDIMQSAHSDTDRILARLDQMETNRLKEQLDAERAMNIALQGRIDRQELRTNIVNDVRPCPSPCYITCNPWASSNTCNCGGCC